MGLYLCQKASLYYEVGMMPVEGHRHDATDYEVSLRSATVAKLERHYIAKAKKHNLSPQDLLHVLPHRCGKQSFLCLTEV